VAVASVSDSLVLLVFLNCYVYDRIDRGCCAFGADCAVICNDGGAAIVAGCVFPPPTEPPTEAPSKTPTMPPTALPTTLPPTAFPTTMPPTALPTTLPPTTFPTTMPPTMSPVTDAPVSTPPTIGFTGKCQLTVNTDQCSMLVPGQPDVEGCDCYNYCDGAPLECCPLGERCPPVVCGSSNFVAGCELNEPTSAPSPVPTPEPQQCSVSVSTGQCSELMQTIAPREPCDCYNFCNGGEIGCCRFDTACPVACTGNFVAGCLEDTPTSPPEPEPMCLTSVDTELCSLFAVGQSPVPDCDCYNYCNGKLSMPIVYLGDAFFEDLYKALSSISHHRTICRMLRLRRILWIQLPGLGGSWLRT
jgi:hypothetical protein